MATRFEPQDGELAGQLFAAAQDRRDQALVPLANLYRDSLRALATRELGKHKLGAACVSSVIQRAIKRLKTEVARAMRTLS